MSVQETKVQAPSRLRRALRERVKGVSQRAMRSGAPPAWFGYRWVEAESLREYFARHGQDADGAGPAGRIETIHPASTASNPLPRNVTDRSALPSDAGWWGYSFHDVPERKTGETLLATLPDCQLAFWIEERKTQFHPAILNQDGRSINMREVVFRPGHAETLRAAGRPVRIERATWILERVYDNHSHWLTAHLPKLCILKARGMLGDVLLPERRSPAMDTSLRMLGLDPQSFRTFDPQRPLQVDSLTFFSTDRYRPELLQMVRSEIAAPVASPKRRVFISRAKSRGRRLLNEDALWPVLADAGFERVFMEELSFEEQVRLMGETEVLAAPHGAGLTNMMFCGAGAHVIEIADLSFPNPNFYALACAMSLHYWLVPAQGHGEGHPLEKDLSVEVEAVRAILDQL